MFIGRKDKIQELENFINSSDKALVLYGKRRVGKSELIKKVFSDKDNCIYFECSEDSEKNNVKRFIELLRAKNYDMVELETFDAVFSFLNLTAKNLIIAIDEFPFLMKHNNKDVICSNFKRIIDTYLTSNKLILCGSNISVMNEILKEKNALFGRFNKIIFLPELNYVEASDFYPKLSNYDKVSFYSIFGGSPYVNLNIDANLSLKDNIINNFLNQNSNVYHYCDKVLLTDIPSVINVNGIFSVIKNGKKTCAEIEDKLDEKKNGNMNKKLTLLNEMNILTKVQPINKMDNRKLTNYELADNALRFFYTFIYPYSSIINTIGANNFYEIFIVKKLTTFISHRFEDIVRNYYSLLAHSGRLKNVKNIGVYYYNNKDKKANGEFDVALQLENDKYKIIEVKYYKDDNKLTISEMKKEYYEVMKIDEIQIDSLAFICTAGYEEGADFECVDFNTLYDI